MQEPGTVSARSAGWLHRAADPMIALWYKVHQDFGAAVARGLGIETAQAAAE